MDERPVGFKAAQPGRGVRLGRRWAPERFSKVATMLSGIAAGPAAAAAGGRPAAAAAAAAEARQRKRGLQPQTSIYSARRPARWAFSFPACK